MQKTMIIMYNNLLKRILFPSLSIYFFPIFSHFFPSPNPNFGASWEKMGIFSISKIESLFPSLSIYFFPHFSPSPNPNFGVPWGKMGLDPHFYVLITNMLKMCNFKYPNWLIDKLVNWTKLKLS